LLKLADDSRPIHARGPLLLQLERQRQCVKTKLLIHKAWVGAMAQKHLDLRRRVGHHLRMQRQEPMHVHVVDVQTLPNQEGQQFFAICD